MLSRIIRFTSTFIGAFALFLFAALSSAPSASADVSHIRIIRISYVQGEVRFARDVKGDPLAGEENVLWENAELNLPVRQGFVISTGNGHAEVEFENGSLALIGENTVLQFFDLSLEDGSKTTRLILRQGTASFSVNPSNGDYFSVTGGDFSVEADGRSEFRIDNFDDGSRVNVIKGRANVLRKKGSTELAKGQTFSMKADDPKNFDVATNTSAGDDFDKWAANRISAEYNNTAAAQQYVNSPNYSSGLSSLYTYGAFYPCQFGNCWRPYGVGMGWSPFDSGFLVHRSFDRNVVHWKSALGMAPVPLRRLDSLIPRTAGSGLRMPSAAAASMVAIPVIRPSPELGCAAARVKVQSASFLHIRSMPRARLRKT